MKLSRNMLTFNAQFDDDGREKAMKKIISNLYRWFTDCPPKSDTEKYPSQRKVIIDVIELICRSIKEKWFFTLKFSNKLFISIANSSNDDDILIAALRLFTRTTFIFPFEKESLPGVEWGLVVQAFFGLSYEDRERASTFLCAIFQEFKKMEGIFNSEEEFKKKLRAWWVQISCVIVPIIIGDTGSNYYTVFFKELNIKFGNILRNFVIERFQKDPDFPFFPATSELVSVFSVTVINSMVNDDDPSSFDPVTDFILKAFPYEITQLNDNELKNHSINNLQISHFLGDKLEYVKNMHVLFKQFPGQSKLSDWVDLFVYSIYNSLNLNDKEKVIKTMQLFRAFWCATFLDCSEDDVVTLLTRIQVRFVTKHQVIGIILILTMFFDRKMPSKPLWDFLESFLNSTIREETADHEYSGIISHFLVQIAVTLSPIFFGLSQKRIEDCIRNMIEHMTYISGFFEASPLIITSPVLFAEGYLCAALESKNVICPSQSTAFSYALFKSNDWTESAALLFVRNMFDSIPMDIKELCLDAFVVSLLEIQESMPLYLGIRRSFICDNFIDIFLEFTEKSHGAEIMKLSALSTCCEVIRKSSFNSKPDNETLEELYINVIHLLVLKPINCVVAAIDACSELIMRFIDSSVVLIPFCVRAILYALKVKANYEKFAKIHVMNLLLSSLAVVLTRDDIEVTPAIFNSLESLPISDKAEENASLLGDLLGTISSDNLKFKSADVLDNILSAITLLYKPGKEDFYHVPFLVSIVAAFHDNKDLMHVADALTSSTLHSISKKSQIKTVQNFKAISSIASKMPSIGTEFIVFLSNFLEETELDASSFASVTSIMCDFITHDPSLISPYFERIEPVIQELQEHNKEEQIAAINDCLNIVMTEKTAGTKKIQADFAGSTFTFYKDKMVQSFRTVDDSLRLTTRVPNGLYTTDILPIFHDYEPKTRDYFSYTESTDYDEEIKESFSSRLTETFGETRCSPSDFSQEYETVEPGSSKSAAECKSKQTVRADEKHDEIETLFNETMFDSCHALFYSLFYDVFSGGMRVHEDNPNISRYVSSIFSLNTDETAKIGVLYVAKNQTNQQEILMNSWSDTSPEFKEFLTSIGEFVDLTKHSGYDGKLDVKRFQNGDYSLYSDKNRTEIMYHVAPLFPSDETDKQQLKKKRHIGNDNVQIVWSESDNEYDTATVKSQFNDAHIIIYPLHNKLFRVTLRMKYGKLAAGPINSSLIVTGKSIGEIVRWSAFLLDKSVRNVTTSIEQLFRETISTAVQKIDAGE